MKKYISIIAVSFALLLGATSCQFNGGSDYDPNRANRMLWHRVWSAIHEQYGIVEVVAQLNDTLCGVVYNNSPYPPCNISEEGGIYTFTYGESNTYYKIKTDGKLLSEGGEWMLYIRYGTYMNWAKMANIKGIVGESNKFEVASDNSETGAYEYCNLSQSTVEYLYDAAEGKILYTFATFNGRSTDRDYTNTEAQYMIEYEAVEPLVLRSGELLSGEIDILYQDFVEHTERTVTVRIVNKIITFAEPKKI